MTESTRVRGYRLADIPDSDQERFWRHVSISDDGCWPWIGGCSDRGYGAAMVGRVRQHAHRVAFAIANGVLPAGCVVMHSCDNPPCVNPEHLRAGTQRDNVMDARRKGRMKEPTHRRLTDEQVLEIKRCVLLGERPSSISRAYGVTRQHVWRISAGAVWANVPWPSLELASEAA